MSDTTSDSDCSSGVADDISVSLEKCSENYDKREDTDEEKVNVEMEPCLVCGHPAVFYDPRGKIIKRDIFTSCQFSFNQLLSSLCHGLGLRKNSKQLRAWDFHNDPFPFCDDCHLIIVSLTQLHKKMEQLQGSIKMRMVTAERKYLEEDLYNKHDQRYYSFRREVIPATVKTSVTSHRSRTQVSRSSNKQVKRMSDNISNEEEFATTSIWCDGVDEIDDELVDLNSTTASPRPTDDNLSTEHCSLKPVASTVPSTPRGRPVRLRRLTNLTGDGFGTANNPSFSKPSSIQKEKKYKRRQLHAGSQIFKKKTKQPKKTLSINTITDKEIIRTIKANYGLGIGNTITQDLKTGNFTYETGFGNRYGTTRVNLKFEIVDGDDTILKCASCSETVPRLMYHKRQTTEFHKHFTKFHSSLPLNARRKCRSKKELQHRLQLDNNLPEVSTIENAEYRSMMGYKASKSDSFVISECECEICGMPFTDIPESGYISHRKTHMNSEDLLVSKNHGRNQFCGLLPTRQPVNGGGRICETCGKVIYGGKASMAGHLQTHLPEEERLSFLCSICGAKFSAKYTLTSHLKKVHDEGEWKGWNVCQFPDCKQSFDTKDTLKGHVILHLESEQAYQNLLCFHCGKTFSTSWSLKIHGTVHSKEKQYECDLCSKTFAQKATLLMHLAAVHRQGEHYGVFECEVDTCSEVFPCDKYRKQHMRYTHGLFQKRKNGEGVQ